MKKFKFTGDITADSIYEFYEDFKAGKIDHYIKSEEEPEVQGPVIKLVATNYDDIVFDRTKDVLVKYYAPWCGHCKRVITSFLF